MDRSSRERIKKGLDSNSTLDQMDLKDIYRTFHPKTAKYTFFSDIHGTFSGTDHTFGHKTSLNELMKIWGGHPGGSVS